MKLFLKKKSNQYNVPLKTDFCTKYQEFHISFFFFFFFTDEIYI